MAKALRLFCLTLVLLYFVGHDGLAETAQDRQFFAGLKAFDAGDYNRVEKLWRPLAETGYIAALLALADFYDRGLSGKLQVARATQLYRAAAHQGHPLAFIALAERALAGVIKPQAAGQDRVIEAYYWYRKAALAGNAYGRKMANKWADKISSDARRSVAERIASEKARQNR